MGCVMLAWIPYIFFEACKLHWRGKAEKAACEGGGGNALCI
jgi:hypothetical protein